MIIAVLDTNVLASGFVSPKLAPGKLLAAWSSGLFTLVVSHRILLELERTFREPYFRKHLTPSQAANNLGLLRDEATITEANLRVQGIATHPEDDLILAAAVSARTDYLVTGDGNLQKLGAYEGVRIVSPRAFLDILLTESSGARE